MAAQIINGKIIADRMLGLLASRLSLSPAIKPSLAVLLVGDNPASKLYIAKKQQACQKVGIKSTLKTLSSTATTDEILAVIAEWNNDDSIHGILVQLPLPKNLPQNIIFDQIRPDKDVDVFHPLNVGLLVQNRAILLPCTPHAIQIMLQEHELTTVGKHAIVISRSSIIGKPLSSMLIQDNGEYANATVTVCHDRTSHSNLKAICFDADIIIVAVGIPGFFTPDMARPHHIIIDVGINRVNGKIVGDVHPGVQDIVSFLSCVPDGVGPLTIACLLENTVKAAEIFWENT